MNTRVITAGVAIVLLSACGSHAASTAPPKTTAPAAVASKATSDLADAVFLESTQGLLTDRTADQMIKLGHDLCNVLNVDGVTTQAAVTSIAQLGMTAENATTLVDASIFSYCPQHKQLVVTTS